MVSRPDVLFPHVKKSRGMKNFTLLVFIVGFVIGGYSQTNSFFLEDYTPAPGQYINMENIGTPKAAQKVSAEISNFVSLGSFGGYIVLQFENPIVNDPRNPYGIDFTIFGNSFAGSSEPGVVWVMEDENQNGLPDDTWYEIAGSHHFFSGTVKDYEVTYYNSSGRNVEWKDNHGGSGVIIANEFNLQEYYPLQQHFPEYPQDSITFTGTLMENHYSPSSSAEIKISPPAFGYADIRSKSLQADLSLPDNPYTPEIEGAGGDPIDISWAIDSQGNYVDLDAIHFVKIVSGSLDVLGWLGEISTEVSWIQPVKANADITGKENILVAKPLPSKILIDELINPEAVYFIKGRKSDVPVLVKSMDENIIGINSGGWLEPKSPGDVQILYSAEKEEEIVNIKVAEPQSVIIQNDFSAVYPGDTLELKADIIDNWQDKLDFKPVFTISGSIEGKIISEGEKYFFVALQPGELTLTASVEEYQLQQQVQVKILSPDDKIKIFVSIKTATENVLPLQWIDIGLTDLNSVVENRNNDYNGSGRLTVAHALAAGLRKSGVSFNFRDDAVTGGELYLYRVEYDGLFSYGWGGRTNPKSNARAWIARLNRSQYLNSFDTVSIADGDTLVLYHVPNIQDFWIYSRLLPIHVGESLSELILEQTQCTLSSNNIAESGFYPVAGAVVQSDKTYSTGADGIVEIEHEELPLLVSSGNDAVLLDEELTTGGAPLHSTFNFYPNPVESTLSINFISFGTKHAINPTIKIYDINGSLLLEEPVSTGPVNLNLSFLKQGIYHLVISDGKRSEIRKILKK